MKIRELINEVDQDDIIKSLARYDASKKAAAMRSKAKGKQKEKSKGVVPSFILGVQQGLTPNYDAPTTYDRIKGGVLDAFKSASDYQNRAAPGR